MSPSFLLLYAILVVKFCIFHVTFKAANFFSQKERQQTARKYNGFLNSRVHNRIIFVTSQIELLTRDLYFDFEFISSNSTIMKPKYNNISITNMEFSNKESLTLFTHV